MTTTNYVTASKKYFAFNGLTKLFWDGKAFAGLSAQAVKVDVVELAVLRYTYLNVSSFVEA